MAYFLQNKLMQVMNIQMHFSFLNTQSFVNIITICKYYYWL